MTTVQRAHSVSEDERWSRRSARPIRPPRCWAKSPRWASRRPRRSSRGALVVDGTSRARDRAGARAVRSFRPSRRIGNREPQGAAALQRLCLGCGACRCSPVPGHQALELLAEILGTAPALSDFSPQHCCSTPCSARLHDPAAASASWNSPHAATVRRHRFQEMDLSRGWANERKFQIGVRYSRHHQRRDAAAATRRWPKRRADARAGRGNFAPVMDGLGGGSR